MKQIASIISVFIILLMEQNAFAQYDYDDGDLKPRRQREQRQDVQEIEKERPDKTPVSDKKFDKSKLYPGGTGGASFSNIGIYITLTPTLMYRVHERVDLGVGLSYDFLSDRRFEPTFKTHSFGGRIFPRVFIWKTLFAQLAYHIDNAAYRLVSSGTGPGYDELRGTFHNVFIGGGYNAPISQRAYLTILIQVNLLENSLYPRRSPLISFGFGVGL